MVRLLRKLRRICAFWFLFLYLFLLSYYFGGFALKEIPLFLRRRSNAPNVLLISIDTLRADHLGCYGYSRNTSPNIDKLSEEGALFKNVIAQASTTCASHMSMMTSLYPTVHGVDQDPKTGANRIDSKVITMAEKFKAYGYRTAAFTGGGGVSNTFGFNEGFDTYEEDAWTDKIGRGSFKIEESGLFTWLEEHRNDKFFLFFHTYMCHDMYAPPPPFNTMFDPDYEGSFPSSVEEIEELDKEIRKDPEIKWERDVWTKRRAILESTARKDPRDLRHMAALYDGGIRWMDSFIGQLVQKVKDLGIDHRTIIVFSSDHGEEFLEHGGFWHIEMYGETLGIPLIIVYPKMVPEGIVINQIVRSIDIYPTVMEMAGIPIRHMIQGVSLLPVINGKEMHLEAFSELLAGPQRMAQSRGWKYIRKWEMKDGEHVEDRELYNLNVDLEEKHNLYETEKEQLARMQKILGRWFSRNRDIAKKYNPVTVGEMDEKLEEQLRAMGYLQ